MKTTIETVGTRPSSAMTDYLPIAEHGIIGDLHSIALVGTDGRIDWYCCPRFDSPSVFGAILDRERGGFYRIAPVLDEWVPKQLYFPDTNVLITRFLTPGGVGEVQDFMPIARGAAAHRHRLIRRVLGVRGEMRFGIDVQPAVRLRPRPPRHDLPREGRALPLAVALARARDVGADALPRGRRARRVHAPAGRDRRLRARAGARELRPAVVPRGGDPRGVRGHGRLLAALARAVALPGPLARDDPPLGADAQADDLRADRRDRRRADDEPARAHRRRSELGLPLHVDPRRVVLALRAPPAGLRRGGDGLHGVAHRAVPGGASRRRRPAPAHVRHRRPVGARGGGAPPPRRLPRLASGPDRERRREAAPARHLRRADRLGVPLQPRRGADLPRRVDGPRPGS